MKSEALHRTAAPSELSWQNAAADPGHVLFQMVFHFIPAMAVSVFFIGIAVPVGPLMLLLFLLRALLGYGILWTISFATQTLSFWLINIWNVTTIKNVSVDVLSGSMIPLWTGSLPSDTAVPVLCCL